MRRSGCAVESEVNDDRGPIPRREVEPDERDNAAVNPDPGAPRKLSGDAEREEEAEMEAADDLWNRLLRKG